MQVSKCLTLPKIKVSFQTGWIFLALQVVFLISNGLDFKWTVTNGSPFETSSELVKLSLQANSLASKTHKFNLTEGFSLDAAFSYNKICFCASTLNAFLKEKLEGCVNVDSSFRET